MQLYTVASLELTNIILQDFSFPCTSGPNSLLLTLPKCYFSHVCTL